MMMPGDGEEGVVLLPESETHRGDNDYDNNDDDNDNDDDDKDNDNDALRWGRRGRVAPRE